MAVVIDRGFEEATLTAAVDSKTDTEGRLVLSTAQKLRGLHSLRDPGGTATARGFFILDGSTQTYAYRVAVRFHVLSGNNCLIFGFQNATKSLGIRVSNASKMQTFVGSTFTNTTTAFSLDTWYLIQGYTDVTPNPPLIHAQLYDATGTPIDTEISTDTVSGAIAAPSSVYCGQNTTSGGYDIYYDSLKLTDAVGDYPLGLPPADSTIPPTLTTDRRFGGRTIT